MKYSFFAFVFFASVAFADVSLPRLISDHMVLQREDTLHLWGHAAAKEKIQISIDQKTYKIKADQQGSWKLDLPPHAAGGPYELKVKGNNEIIIHDVLFGDVWLCTGQSNMVLPMERVKEKYSADIADANNPNIRNFFIKTMTDLTGPRQDLPDGQWIPASPETVLAFGAVTYFFARDIYTKYKVPIGIINSSVGGTPIEAWISEGGFKDFDSILKTIGTNKDTSYIAVRMSENRKHAVNRTMEDQGLLQTPKWSAIDYNPVGWANINIPGFWEDQGLRDLDGVVWYRREIDVPTSMSDQEVKLYMGRIVDADQFYVNGTQVGNVTYQYPPRRYTIAKGLLHPGKNILVIRVVNTGGKGGFVPDKPYYMTANDQVIDLKGTWQYKIGQVYEPAPFFPGFSAQNQPAALYNAMTAPVVAQTSVKGVLWYQGESNTGNPGPYESYMEALIENYRRLFGKPDLPFLTVQLANFMDQDLLPTESSWAALRYAQFKASRLPHAGLAVITDLGEWNDIHPLNKQDVGSRLALAARNLAYGEHELNYSGPSYSTYSLEGDKVILSFDHIGTGLRSADGLPLKYFAIAGANKKYTWAEAVIRGDQVVVHAARVPNPLCLRYAWANNPVGANLTNDTGIPASCFEIAIDVQTQKN
ncbi:MAG: sialate O-acetylesterase [Saprospiraceae bacterium]|nr:sialate O-acetylesterase [Saprospiraceae bacterium]